MKIEMWKDLITLSLTQAPITIKVKILCSQFIICALLMLKFSMNEFLSKFMINSSIVNSN